MKYFQILSSLLLVSFCLGGCVRPETAKRVVDQIQEEAVDRTPVVEDRLEENVVWFEFDSSLLSAKARKVIEGQVRWLAAHPQIMSVTLEGHCDKTGTREYNLALGERRAEQVKRYMISRGIAPERLEVRSYGKERLVNLGDSPEDQAENRRVVVVLTK